LHHRVIENERADAESTLSQARRQFHRANSVETVVDHGSAVEVIVARAQMTDSTLIAMATHGRSGVARALLGSVAVGVIRRSGVPVLAVRPRLLMPPHAPQRVLVPLDTSDLAASVIPYVVQLARELDWSLILCSVVDLPPPSLSVQGAAIPLGRVPARPPAEVMDYLDQTAADLRAQGLDVAINAGTGDRATAIVEAAQKTRSGLIAMSTHGRHGVGRLAFGSVAEAVIRHAEVPVLAVHPRQVEIGARAAMSPAEATAT
jgi:nucleotide-binding universal stress UspA family protein